MIDRAHEDVDEPIGQAPDDLAPPGIADLDPREFGVGRVRAPVGDVPVRIEHPSHRKPEGVGDFALLELERSRVGRVIDVGCDDETMLAELRIPLKIAQGSEVFGPVEGDTDLLEGFALGRGARVHVDRFDAPTREGHVTRPRVAGAGGSLDEEDLGLSLPFAQDESHRSLTVIRHFDLLGSEAFESLSDVIQVRHGATIARRPAGPVPRTNELVRPPTGLRNGLFHPAG